MLHNLDLIAIGGYLILLLCLGFYKPAKKENDFILAGRKLSLPGFIATLVATWYGGILGVGENTYNFGIQTWFIFALPYYIFGILYALFLAPRIRHWPHLSIPDHFNRHFGKSTGIISAGLILILSSPAPYILSLGFLLQHTFNWELQTATIAAAILSMAYIWFGGFRSVIRTDTLQFIMMFVGFIILLGFAWSYSDSPVTLRAVLPKHFFDPTGEHSIQYILVWFFIALWTFIDPGFYQRTAAASTPHVAQRGILTAIGFWAIFDLLTVTTGLYAAAILPQHDAVLAYPDLAARILPPFFYGLFLVGLFSTIMSTIDSNGLISAITFGRDIMWRIKEQDNAIDSTMYMRRGVVVMGFIALLLAVSIPSVVRLWYILGSIIIPGILFPFLLTFSNITVPKEKINLVIILPVVSALLCFILGYILDWYPGNIEPFYPGILLSFILIVLWKK